MSQLELFAILILSVTLLTGCGKSEITQSCSMNAFGQGECSFTNTGDATGSTCGSIQVKHPYYEYYDMENHVRYDIDIKSSAIFCSGEVKQSSTNKVEFSVFDIADSCSSGFGESGCKFEWVKK
jgi:hypothetical protein